jgi:hypothetical protein
MSHQKKIAQPDATTKYVGRIWHWRKKCYLYASDYGLKGFPIG